MSPPSPGLGLAGLSSWMKKISVSPVWCGIMAGPRFSQSVRPGKSDPVTVQPRELLAVLFSPLKLHP